MVSSSRNLIQPINKYLQTLETNFNLVSLPYGERAANLEEISAHLAEQAADLEKVGYTRFQAEYEATRAFGQPDVLAQRIADAYPRRWNWLRWLGWIALCILALWLLLIVVMTLLGR